MKCRLIKNEIQEVFSKIQGICSRKTNLSITSTVKLTAAGDSICVEVTDLETDFSGTYPAQVEKEGSICLNAKKLYEIIRSFPHETVLINEIENRWVEIGEDIILYHIVGMNPEDFPEIGKSVEGSFISVDSGLLKKMFEKSTSIQAVPDEKRIYAQGILFESLLDEEDNPFLRCVSTDVKRMVRCDIPCEKSFVFPEGTESILIPKKGLTELLKFLDSPIPVEIGMFQNRFVLKKESEIFSITLLEGKFPEYRGLFSYDSENIIAFTKQDLLMSLRRMSILSDNDLRSILFSFEENKLTLTSSNPDLGESREDLFIAYEKTPFEVAFNPKFFMDALSIIEEEDVHIFIKNNQSPCIVKGDQNDDVLSVLMPIRI